MSLTVLIWSEFPNLVERCIVSRHAMMSRTVLVLYCKLLPGTRMGLSVWGKLPLALGHTVMTLIVLRPR